MLNIKTLCVSALMILVVSVAAQGSPIPVGTGDNHAIITVNFSGGGMCVFEVAFSVASISGLEAFDIIEAGSTLTTVRNDFGWGEYIDGISFGPFSNIGFGGGENWWHYYVMDEGDTNWTSPMYGASDRTLADGGADGWVYGSTGMPQIPEPTTMTLLLIGAAAVARFRKQ